MATCLNFNIPQVKQDFEELTNVFRNENIAYALMSQNNGFNLDLTPEGAPSALYESLLTHPGIQNDRTKALRYKSKIYTDSYLDVNDWIKQGQEPNIDTFGEHFNLPRPIIIPETESIQLKGQKFLKALGGNVARLFDAASFRVDTPEKWNNIEKMGALLSKVSDLFRKHGLFVHKGNEHIMKLNADLFENLFDEQRLVDRVNEYMRTDLAAKNGRLHNVISRPYQGERWLVTTDEDYNKEDPYEKHQNRRRKIIARNLERIALMNKKFMNVVGVEGVSAILVNPEEVKRGELPKHIVKIDNEVLQDYNQEMYIRYLNSMNDILTRNDDMVRDDFVLSPVKQRMREEQKRLRVAKATLEQSGGKLSKINELENKIDSLTQRLDTLDKDAELQDIYNEANIQLQEIEEMLKKPILTPAEIRSATKKLELWLRAGDFSQEDHPILDEEMAEDEEIQKAFYAIRDKAAMLNNKIVKKGKNSLLTEVSKELVNPDGTDLTFKQILRLTHKYGYWNMMTLSLNRVGHGLAQFISKIVNEANDLAFREAKIHSRYLADLYEKLKQSGFDERKFYQKVMVSTSNGMEEMLTGRLLHKFSNVWFKKYRELRTNKELRDTHIITINPELLFDTPAGKESERDAHEMDIRQTLGALESEKYLKKAAQLYTDFKHIREEFIKAEFGDGPLTNEEEAVLAEWDKNNSPIKRIEAIANTKKKDISRVPGKDTFLVLIPRRTVKGKDTGYYDANFDEIENNSAAYEFYQHAEEITKNAQAIFGYSDFTQTSMAFIEASLMTKLMGKGIAEFMTKDAFSAIADSFAGSQPNANTIDPITGQPKKELKKGVVAIDKRIENQAELAVNRLKKERKAAGNEEELTAEEENDIMVEASKQIFNEMGFEQNSNLFASLNILNSSALTYRHLSTLEDTINLAMTYLPKSTLATGEDIIDKDGNVVGKQYVQNLMNAVRHFLDTTYYKEARGDTSGHILTIRTKTQKKETEKWKAVLEDPEADEDEKSYAKYKLGTLGTKVTVNSMVKQLMNFMRVKALGWNVGAAFVNLTYGTITNMYKAFEGRMFTAADWLKAEKETMVHLSKFNKVVENYHIIGDILYEFEETNKFKEKQSYFFRTLKSLKPYVLQTNVEKKNQGTVMIAMMLHQKVTNSATGEVKSLWEAINDNGQLDDVWQLGNKRGHDAIVHTISSIKSTIDEIHGDYRSNLMAKDTMIGRTLTMFRLWFFEFWNMRFGAEKPDYIRGIVTKGRYRTAFELAKKFKLNPVELWTKYKSNQLSEVDKANVRMNLAELATIIGLFFFKYMLKEGICGDDKKCKDANIVQLTVLNLVNKLFKDVSMPFSPQGWKDFVSNPTSLTSILGDAAKALDLMGKSITGEPEDLVYQSGYNEGQSKWKVFWKSQIPFINQLERGKKYGEELINLQ